MQVTDREAPPVGARVVYRVHPNDVGLIAAGAAARDVVPATVVEVLGGPGAARVALSVPIPGSSGVWIEHAVRGQAPGEWMAE